MSSEPKLMSSTSASDDNEIAILYENLVKHQNSDDNEIIFLVAIPLKYEDYDDEKLTKTTKRHIPCYTIYDSDEDEDSDSSTDTIPIKRSNWTIGKESIVSLKTQEENFKIIATRIGDTTLSTLSLETTDILKQCSADGHIGFDYLSIPTLVAVIPLREPAHLKPVPLSTSEHSTSRGHAMPHQFLKWASKETSLFTPHQFLSASQNSLKRKLQDSFRTHLKSTYGESHEDFGSKSHNNYGAIAHGTCYQSTAKTQSEEFMQASSNSKPKRFCK